MSAYLTTKPFYTLSEIEEGWRASALDIRQWLTRGELSAHVWVLVTGVFQIQEMENADSGEVVRTSLYDWEGYVQISKYLCYRLYKYGRIAFREFTDKEGENNYRLSDTADDIMVTLDELVILPEERKRFEEVSGLSSNEDGAHHAKDGKQKNGQQCEIMDVSCKTVNIYGRHYHLGNMQAKIIKLLCEAANKGEPWQSGKRLLGEAGSQSFALASLFNRNPVWKELIVSDRRGFYRLNERFISTVM